jgi:L,D-transpeptidase catalytic domain
MKNPLIMRITKSVSVAAFFLLLLTAPTLMVGSAKKNSPLPFKSIHTSSSSAFMRADMMYDSMQLDVVGLSKQAFEYAVKGYEYLRKKNIVARESVLSICDFSQSSRKKRLYIIDMESMRLLLNTYVAHGRNSGSEFARAFSNSPESHKSSLGFYVTKNTYVGEHGLSLRIQGLERGFNDRADKRNIVVHGSEYVGADFIRNNPFTGRSYGCPAVPSSEIIDVINTIKGGTCLFIYHPSKQYITKSRILNS